MKKENIENKQIITKNEFLSNPQKCIFCNSLTDLILFDQTDICKKCFDEQLNELKAYGNKKTKFYPEIDKITDRIYLGNEDVQRDKEKLKSLNVTHILNCAAFIENFHPEDFIYENLYMDDSVTEDLNKFMSKAFEFIEKSDVIFIHCQAGISRSAAIVIAYLMWKNKINFDTAFNLVKFCRKCICPNSGFINQLRSLEKNFKI